MRIDYKNGFMMRTAIAVLCSVSGLLAYTAQASADTTPTMCPPGLASKYGCSYAVFQPAGPNVNVQDRVFNGSNGGSCLPPSPFNPPYCDRWQMYRTKEWDRSGASAYTFQALWGETGWRDDTVLSPNFSLGVGTTTRLADAVVSFQHQYENYILNDPGNPNSGYYIQYNCQYIHWHYLQNSGLNYVQLNQQCLG